MSEANSFYNGGSISQRLVAGILRARKRRRKHPDGVHVVVSRVLDHSVRPPALTLLQGVQERVL